MLCAAFAANAAARYTLVHLLRGRLAQCLESAEQALALGEQLGGISYLGGEATMAQAQAQVARGEYPAAKRTLQMAYDFFQQFPHGQAAVNMLVYLKGVMAYHEGQMPELRHAMSDMETVRIPGEWAVVETLRRLLAGVVALGENNFDEAERVLREVARHQEQTPTSVRFGGAQVWLAHLYLRRGWTDKALEEFASFLTRCQQQGMAGRALLEGAAVVPLLRLAVERNVHPTLAAHLLDTLGASESPRSLLIPETGETLTPREVEILRQMALGTSNRAIAEGLCLTEGTVKSHVHHILEKLGVVSRTEAAARARRLRVV